MLAKIYLTEFSSLIEEWHYSKNGDLDPHEISHGCNKKVWWKCQKKHEWEAVVSNRTNGKNCPYCSGNKVCIDNCLATINPSLAKEWHPTKNGDKTPHNYTSSATYRAWWFGSCGHEWDATIANRNRLKGCPYCSKQKINIDNCLATTHPNLAKEWHPTKNGNKTPHNVKGGRKKYWWICKKGHEWDAVIESRMRLNCGCPYCSNHKVCIDNCLTTINPELAKEWHPSKNGDKTPYNFTYSSGFRAWWICKKGHQWKASVNTRNHGHGCPVCRESKGEKKVAAILDKLKISYEREKRFKKCKKILPLSFDFNVNKDGLPHLIEFQGQQHYKAFHLWKIDKRRLKLIQKRDQIKRNFCEKENIPLLEIPYWKINDMEDMIIEFLGL